MQSSTLLIVGIGASAGGLDAIQEFLCSLDDADGIAIVVVQHLEKDSERLLIELLAQSTSYRVIKVTGLEKLCARTIYVCPSRALLEVKGGVCQLARCEDSGRPSTPIDHLLQSLADDQTDRSVGIILSGTGSDGTLGVKAISDAGGMTFAQSPQSAKYDSMPRSASMIGVADHILSPQEIATELKRYASFLAGHANELLEPDTSKEIHDAIPAIAKLLMEATNHNFQHYKPNTLARRIRRRMQVLKIPRVQQYVTFLNEDVDEPQKLFRELLISVTEFFRDPEAFESLAQTVIPKLLAHRKVGDVVRIWVPGCATGEEAFTLAMLCLEHMDQLQSPPEVQIFATDIDERALNLARQCTYALGIEEDLSKERLARFFVKRGNKYQLVKEVRDLVLFSTHNLISDPPFSRQDLISCRNLLIYLGPHLQKKLIPLFHYALRPAGFLMLGPSENIASHADLFRTIDEKHRISQRKGTGADATEGLVDPDGGESPLRCDSNRLPMSASGRSPDLIQVMQRIVLDEFAPKSVIIEEDGKILCASADMHKYLTVGTGNFQNNIIHMARDGLRVGIRAALQEARVKRRRVVHDELSVRVDGKLQRVMLTVQPMPKIGEEAELFMVVFHDCGLPLPPDEVALNAADNGNSEDPRCTVVGADAIIVQLERELSSTRADLENSIRDLEIANEELKSSNEELRSLNEEMQSANEELETSKEEIQAGVTALGKIHSDLENLFQSTQIATLFLDSNGHIIRITPATANIYNLISTDVGRPLDHITNKLTEMPRVPTLAELTVTKGVLEEEVHALDGRWYLRRALPYFHDKQAEGVILTFIDITERKRSTIRLSTMHEELREEAARKSAILEAALDPIVTMDKDGCIVEFNPAAELAFGFNKDEVQGQTFLETIIPDEYRETHAASLAQYLQTGESSLIGRRHELNALRKDGSVFPIELAISAITARDGTPFFTAHMRDISFHQQFIQDIVDRDNRITALLNSTAEGIYGIGLDGLCTFANVSCARLLGHDDPQQLIGKHMHELIHHTRPNGERYGVDDCKIYKAFRLGESTHADDEVYWRADGTSFDVEYWSFPQKQDGKIVGCVVSFLDITDRKELLRDLAEREAHLRRVIDNMLGFVGVLDADGVLQDINEAALVVGGLARHEVIGKPFWECYWWSHDEGLVKKLKIAIANALKGEVIRYDAKIRTAFDSRLDVDFMLAPIKDSNGKVTYLIPSGIDISERKAAELKVTQQVAQLDLALESGRMGMWEWDIPSDSVRWSAQIFELFGYSEGTFEPTKAGFLAIIHPDDRKRLDVLIASAFSGRCVNHEVEFRVIRGDNQGMVWTHCRGMVRRDTDGNPLAILSALVDITDRKQRELSLEFLANLHAELSVLSTSEAIIAAASQKVSEFLQLSHFLLLEVDANAGKAVAVADHCRDGSASLLGTYEMSQFITDDERRKLAAGLPVIVDDTASPERPIEFIRNLTALNIGSFVNAPSSRDQNLRFMLSAIRQKSHVWRKDEIDLLRELSNIMRLKLDRTDAQKALTESEIKFRLLADNISQFAWMTDSTGAVVWYNQRWFDFTGTTLEEMKDWGWKAVQHPDHLDRVRKHWQECLASGTIWEDTFPLRSKSGEYRWFLSRAQPIRDEVGNIVRWFGTNTDITEAKEQEQRIRESEERLRSAAQAAGFGMVHVDLPSRTATISDELRGLIGISGVEHQRFLIQTMPEWIHADDHVAFNNYVRHLTELDEGKTTSIDFRINRPDGEIRWVRLQAKPVYTGSYALRQPTQLIGTVLDITKQREFEQSLTEARAMAEAANESKSAFLANMSHEIRTPMTAILGYTDLVADSVQDDQAVAHLRTIRRNGYFLLDIINDILDLSKIEAGMLEVVRERFAPVQLVEDVRSIMDVRAAENQLTLEVEYRGMIPNQIESDSKRLKQILINLVGNAIKFTKQGRVQVVVSYRDNKLIFEIIDTGIGISSRQLKRLFQPFSQGDNTVNREFGGTGLGLVISQRLAGMLGGSITVESETQKGSKFTVAIVTGNLTDVEYVQPSITGELPTSSVVETSFKLACHILIVDDRRDIRFLSRRILTEAGATVAEAEDGEVALQTVTKAMTYGEQIDLIILDMQMPKLDGYETAKQLRKLGFLGPIIALTADAMQGDMTRCIECGCNNYLSKPIDKTVMLQMVSSYMAHK